MKYCNLLLLSCLMGLFIDQRVLAQEQEDDRAVKIRLDIVVKGVFGFFDLFSDSRGCVQGKILNFTLQKLLDPNLKVDSLCLKKISGYNQFNITWKLSGEENFYSRKLGVSFKNRGIIAATFHELILYLKVKGLHYHIQRNPQKIMHAMARFNVKELQLIESAQHIQIKTSSFLIPVIIEGGMSYYLKNFYLEQIRILGIKFKIKRKRSHSR